MLGDRRESLIRGAEYDLLVKPYLKNKQTFDGLLDKLTKISEDLGKLDPEQRELKKNISQIMKTGRYPQYMRMGSEGMIDYYKLLDIDRDASEEDIKAAIPECREKTEYKNIEGEWLLNVASSILLHPEKKEIYDKGPRDYVKSQIDREIDKLNEEFGQDIRKDVIKSSPMYMRCIEEVSSAIASINFIGFAFAVRTYEVTLRLYVLAGCAFLVAPVSISIASIVGGREEARMQAAGFMAYFKSELNKIIPGLDKIGQIISSQKGKDEMQSKEGSTSERGLGPSLSAHLERIPKGKDEMQSGEGATSQVALGPSLSSHLEKIPTDGARGEVRKLEEVVREIGDNVEAMETMFNTPDSTATQSFG